MLFEGKNQYIWTSKCVPDTIYYYRISAAAATDLHVVYFIIIYLFSIKT